MTQILCRLAADRVTPVVYIPHSVDDGHILAWINGKESIVPLAQYHTTLPLSASDEEILRQRYAKATGDEFVQVRHRLPRTTPVRENVLTKGRINATPAVQTGALTSAEKKAQKAADDVANKLVLMSAQEVGKTLDVAQATPGDVMIAIQQAKEAFIAKIDGLMQSLAAKA